MIIEWINVYDRLRVSTMDVLVTVQSMLNPNDYYVTVCEYGEVRDDELGFVIFDAYYQDIVELSNVVAWMPLSNVYRPS